MADAGVCNDARAGEMNFIQDQKNFIFCETNEWKIVDLKGKDGDEVSDEWRSVWKEKVQSTAQIMIGLSLYNNAAIAAVPGTQKIHRFYDQNPQGNDRCTFQSGGSGFVVSLNIVATNGHVVDPWRNFTLNTVMSSCGVTPDSRNQFFAEVFDFCTDVLPLVPENARPLTDFLDLSTPLASDNLTETVSLFCFDGTNRAANAVAFAAATIRLRNFITLDDVGNDPTNPTFVRNKDIDLNLSSLLLSPSMTLAGIHAIFPNEQGHLSRSDFTNWVPVTNMDVSIGATDDMVLLEVNTADRNPVVLNSDGFAPDVASTDGIRLQEDVLLIGYSRLDPYAHFVTGNINQSVRFDQMIESALARAQFYTADDRTVYQYDLVSGGGSSGSPVFNIDGEVVAYNFAGDTAAADTAFGYSLEIRHVADFLANPRQWVSPANTPRFKQ